MRKVLGITINCNETKIVADVPKTHLPENENGIVDCIKQISQTLSYIEDYQYGVGIIYIIKDGNSIGRIRYSKKRDQLRLDYTNLKSGKISFAQNAKECKDMIEADISE